MSFLPLIKNAAIRQRYHNNTWLSKIYPSFPMRYRCCNASTFAGELYHPINHTVHYCNNMVNHIHSTIRSSIQSTALNGKYHMRLLSLTTIQSLFAKSIVQTSSTNSRGVVVQCTNTTSTAILQPTTEPLTASSTGALTQVFNDLLNGCILQIKRTFQPSIIRKKRKTGFLVRKRTVGGRKMLARRRAKGRVRLGGGI